jgi:hypothetical protein
LYQLRESHPKGRMWHLLTDEEKRELVAAVKEEFPDED